MEVEEDFCREEELVVKCCSLLDNIVLQVFSANTWFWKLYIVQGYSVKGVYNLLAYDD